MRNLLGGMNSRLGEAEEQISDLEKRLMESNHAEHNQKRKKNYGEKNSLRNSMTPIKCNKHLHYQSLRRRRENRAENLSEELIAENVSNLGKEMDIRIWEAQGTPIKIKKSRSTPRYIVIKLAKYSDKEKNFKAERQKKSVT